ncbi:DUF4395 domain-containing protein [Lysinibacillus sphaericus]|uniref:DUF4395 domain-containing protein n=2 Tax=Lysinibacillus TaxID=400634 RepID=A0A2S0K5R3_LYSSH|nr:MULTISPECIES: DUF4395 domain-containing protein [Lysinibacillus]AVK98604.1 hypothetical protein LS41612_20905 [Lysinibacillus sphaericus]MCS1381125.1 DUF4395 domain-containing protein [Lysinibacillus sphaericus]MED4544137.1 DUF4395 domain-containing protein [Lysinibacillus sphaericus]TKI17315.1 DUF4395 domain-containing protein [Lysinibacillus sphaericus]TKI48985.1 DUF4395 domain-containing protein [Lysinibacillus tabacifolii]
MSLPYAIPRPLVRLNQWTILLSVIVTWITGLAWILVIPLVANLLGVLCNFNPIIRLGKLFLKKAPASYIPEDGQQQKFNSSIASICLAGGFVGFFFNWHVVGYVLTTMVAIASSVAIAGFCIGCFLHFQLKQWQYRRSLKKAL